LSNQLDGGAQTASTIIEMEQILEWGREKGQTHVRRIANEQHSSRIMVEENKAGIEKGNSHPDHPTRTRFCTKTRC
jgi:hypothetical protein